MRAVYLEMHLALARQRTVTPALPAAIVLATLLLAAAVLVWRPLGAALVDLGQLDAARRAEEPLEEVQPSVDAQRAAVAGGRG